MKKWILMVLLSAAMTNMFAQTEANVPAAVDCETKAKIMNAPYYYCDCEENSTDFAFPLEIELTDTTWVKAFVADISRGYTAYWFSDSAVVLEVYPLCISRAPAVSFTIEGNKMSEMDSKQITKKLEEAGDEAREVLAAITPHVRVYPVGGGTGKGYVYPYGQAPHSTCENTLPLLPDFRYVCDKEENVYRMKWSDIFEDGKVAVIWRQKDQKPGEIWITKGACDGEEIGRAELTDAEEPFIPDSAALVLAREEQQDIWLHIKHAGNMVGRVIWTKYVEENNEGVEDVAEENRRAYKRLQDGRMCIVIDEETYTLTGQKITR